MARCAAGGAATCRGARERDAVSGHRRKGGMRHNGAGAGDQGREGGVVVHPSHRRRWTGFPKRGPQCARAGCCAQQLARRRRGTGRENTVVSAGRVTPALTREQAAGDDRHDVGAGCRAQPRVRT